MAEAMTQSRRGFFARLGAMFGAAALPEVLPLAKALPGVFVVKTTHPVTHNVELEPGHIHYLNEREAFVPLPDPSEGLCPYVFKETCDYDGPVFCGDDKTLKTCIERFDDTQFRDLPAMPPRWPR